MELSDTLSQIGDWICQHCAELGLTISIPVVLGFVMKIITDFIKNKATIKKAVLDATNTLKNGVDILNDRINQFELKTQENIDKLEDNIAGYIDNKFEKLREKRIQNYNKIINGVEYIEDVTEIADNKIDDIIDEVEKETEEIIKETDNIKKISVDDLI